MPHRARDTNLLSLPGMTRQSIRFERLFAKMMDTRVKPAYDAEYFVRTPCSRFEETARRILGRALLRHRFLQPLDFRGQQRDALGEFLDGQQVQVLPDLVADFLPRLVVILGGHRS